MKLKKDKVIPNHIQQNQILDMANSLKLILFFKSQLFFSSNFHSNV